MGRTMPKQHACCVLLSLLLLFHGTAGDEAGNFRRTLKQGFGGFGGGGVP